MDTDRVYDTREFFLETFPLANKSLEYEATHAAADLTYTLLYLFSISPLTTLFNKQIATLKHIAAILNMFATQQEQPPPK